MPKKSAMLICGMKGMAAQHVAKVPSPPPPPPWQGPSSAPAPPRGAAAAPLRGAAGGSGRLSTPRGETPAPHWAPRHCLGCSSRPPPKSFSPVPRAFDTFQAEGVKELAGESGVDEKMVIANF